MATAGIRTQDLRFWFSYFDSDTLAQNDLSIGQQITEEEFIFDCLNNEKLFKILCDSTKKPYDTLSLSSSDGEDGDDADDLDQEFNLETEDASWNVNAKIFYVSTWNLALYDISDGTWKLFTIYHLMLEKE